MLTRFIDVNGVLTRCMVAGDPKSPAVLLLHGLSLTSEVWVRNIDALGKDLHVIAVDLLGHGFTKPLDGRLPGMTEKIEHLEALIDVLGLQQVSLCGSSYGGLIAANVVLRGKKKIDRLVINGSGSAFNTEDQLSAFMERIHQNYRPTLAASSPEMWRQRLTGTVLDPDTLPCELLAVLPLCYAHPWVVPCWDATIDIMRTPEKFRPFRILDRLEQLDLPTLVVWGRDDKGGIYESAVTATARMPQAKLVAFDNCAHLPMVEHPEQYNTLLRDFLLAQPGAQPRKA
jgi:2-hydroxy-6-oxonona-2,4-dienedioate hydrolase